MELGQARGLQVETLETVESGIHVTVVKVGGIVVAKVRDSRSIADTKVLVFAASGIVSQRIQPGLPKVQVNENALNAALAIRAVEERASVDEDKAEVVMDALFGEAAGDLAQAEDLTQGGQ